MSSPSNMFEMKSFNNSQSQQPSQLDKLPQIILPNVMKMLGQHSAPAPRLHLPTYSIFYISPLSKFTLVYNLIYFLLFYFIQVHICLVIAFGQSFLQTEFVQTSIEILYWFVFGFMVVDIFVSFNKGYYEYGKGKVCDDFSKIIKNYLKTQIYFDLLSVGMLVVPKVYNQANQNVNLLLFVPIVFLWVKKFKYQKEVTNILQYKWLWRVLFTLGTLFLDVLLQGHYGACIFAKIDLFLWSEQYYGNSVAYYWLSNNNNYSPDLMSAPWYDQYVYAQSFSTGTLSTLAPGPFVKNPIQICYALFVMIYFMLLASYIGQVLINVLYNEEAKRVFHEENIQDFDKYMILKDISENLKTRIYNFFELVWSVQSRLQTQEQNAVINMLPMNLKEELLVEICFIKNFFLLQYVQEPKALEKQFAMRINRVVMDSDTCIFKQGNMIKQKQQQWALTSNNIYFISQGMVKFYVCLHNKQFQSKNRKHSFFNLQPSLQASSSFRQQKEKQVDHSEFVLSLSNTDKFIGLYEFVTRRAFSYCCKAIELCQVDTISRKDFMQVLKFTKSEEIYQKLRHEVLVENNLQIINKICSICFQSHIQERCPVINVKERITQSMMSAQDNYGRHQFRKNNWKRIMNEQRNHRRLRSKKVLLKEKPLLKQTEQSALSIFSQVFQNSNIKLDQILLSVAKLNQIEQWHIWRNFYPQYNVDRLNYLIMNRK